MMSLYMEPRMFEAKDYHGVIAEGGAVQGSNTVVGFAALRSAAHAVPRDVHPRGLNGPLC